MYTDSFKNSIVARASPCPTITPTMTYCHSARRMSCGVRRGEGSLVVLIYGEGEDEPQSN
ncbi:hypothetical protein YC2023_058770 [Brassica napus]